MSSAYATFAAGGVYSEPTAIRKVVLANGQPDADAGWGKVKRKRVIPAWVAWEVTKILEDNIEGGTGTERVPRPAGRPGRPARPRTTPTRGSAATCPNLQATVWVGYPRREIPMENVHGIRVAGRHVPGADLGHLHADDHRREAGRGVEPAERVPDLGVPPAAVRARPGSRRAGLDPPPETTETETTTQETEQEPAGVRPRGRPGGAAAEAAKASGPGGPT